MNLALFDFGSCSVLLCIAIVLGSINISSQDYCAWLSYYDIRIN